ncbi:MAG TPA: alpha/beta hydrolase [Aliidongia sp.]|nr:alpha/beta hydrolase [Aliidongia sp.]
MPDRPDAYDSLARGPAASIAYRKYLGRSGRPGVVFLGGFRSDLTGIKARHIDRLCRAQDRSYVRFDYQGHGASSTRFEDCTVGLWLEDALAIIDQLTEGPQILVGSSMGGWLALLAGLQRPDRIAGIAAVAPATDFTETLLWARLDEERRREMVESGRLTIPSAYDPAGYVVTTRLVEEGRRHLLLDAPIPLGCPVRLLHGMQDADVPWHHSVKLVEALAGGDATLTLVKDGDHRLSRPQDLARLGAALGELG